MTELINKLKNIYIQQLVLKFDRTGNIPKSADSKSNKILLMNNFDKGHSYLLFRGNTDGLFNIYEAHCCAGHNVNILKGLAYCLDAISLHILKRHI